MASNDHRPLLNTPVTARISKQHNNRLGAVYSSLYSFWTARSSATTANRRDSYTVILFDENVTPVVNNDTTSAPDALLTPMLREFPEGLTNFNCWMDSTQARMEKSWNAHR
jgi:hypothetical protein